MAPDVVYSDGTRTYTIKGRGGNVSLPNGMKNEFAYMRYVSREEFDVTANNVKVKVREEGGRQMAESEILRLMRSEEPEGTGGVIAMFDNSNGKPIFTRSGKITKIERVLT